MSESFEVMLDLRGAARSSRSRGEVEALLEELAQALRGRPVQAEHQLVFEADGEGRIALEVLGVPQAPQDFAPDVVIVRGVWDTGHRPHCQVCQAANVRRTALVACTCPRCWDYEGDGPKSDASWLCDEHTLLLVADLRPLAPSHQPPCPETGEPSTFVCRGPLCGRGRAWGARMLASDPQRPERVLCRHCYVELFPPCSYPGCTSLGMLRCEHFDRTAGKACGRTLCSEHGRRWQVFGPHRMGLERCPEHGRIDQLNDAELFTQLALGTAGRVIARRSQRGRERFEEYTRLPTLGSVRHILIKARGIKPDLSRLLEQFRALDWKDKERSEPYATASRLLRARESSWGSEVGTSDKRQAEGEALFAKLVQLVRDAGDARAADSLQFSHYSRFVPRDNVQAGEQRILFVLIDFRLKNFFRGPDDAHLKRYSRLLGITEIRFHKALQAK